MLSNYVVLQAKKLAVAVVPPWTKAFNLMKIRDAHGSAWPVTNKTNQNHLGVFPH